MKTITLFLASSNELKTIREQFEIEINRKNKVLLKKGIFIHLDIWEDLSARMSGSRSQDEYNKKIKEADIFVLLAFSKVGMYTEEEFETAFGHFKSTQKPFIFTYFQNIDSGIDDSLTNFQDKLKTLGHFYAPYSNFDNLWNQFNKELDRLVDEDFKEFKYSPSTLQVINQGDNSTYIGKVIHYGEKSIKKFIGSIPRNPDIFLGRDDDLENISELLFGDEHVLLLVNGEGGIGKTSVASKYYHKHIEDYSHLIWTVVDKSIDDALLNLAIELKLSFEPNQTHEDKINFIIKELINLEKPSLLVIDNADDIDALSKSYPLLRSCSNLHILLTTRITELKNAKIYPIKRLSKEKAKELFTKHYKNYDESEEKLLEEILEAVGYNTLVIELLSENLNNFNNQLKTKYTLANLLDDLQKNGVLGLSKSKDVTTDYKLQTAKPQEIVNAMYTLSNLNDNEKKLLSIFSVLPTINISFSFFEELYSNETELDENMLLLSRKGWLDFDKSTKSFKCNPIVQEITRKQNSKLLYEHCEELVVHLIEKLLYDAGTGHLINSSYGMASTYIHYATTLVNYLGKTHDIAVLLERIGTFYQTYGNLEKALKYYEDCLKLSKELHEENPQNIVFKNGLATSYSKLGEIHTTLGNLEKAIKYYEDDLKLSKELYEDNPQNIEFKNGLAISYSKLGEIYIALGNLDKAQKYYEDYLKLSKELHKDNPQNIGFKNSLAISYSKLGGIYTASGDLEKALKYYEDDLKLSKELHKENPQNIGFKNGLAISYSKLGNIHTTLGNLDKALKYYEDYLKLRKELHEENPQNIGFKNGLAISYAKLGLFHSDKDGVCAKEYFDLSKEHFMYLAENFPLYPEFQTKLEHLENQIAALDESSIKE